MTHEEIRKQVWKDAFCAVAGANDCRSVDVAITWADDALEAFDENFKAPPPLTQRWVERKKAKRQFLNSLRRN